MSRLAVLRRHPKRTLAGLTVALAAVGVAVGSGATFSSSTSDSTSTFTAGQLHASANGTGNAFTATFDDVKPGFGWDVANSKPLEVDGGTNYGQLVLTNDGNLANDITFVPSATSYAYGSPEIPEGTITAAELCGGTCLALGAAPDGLQVTIKDIEGGTTWTGAVSDVANATTNLASTFTLANEGDTRTYKLYFGMPTAAGNVYQGGNATVTLTFNGLQQ